MTDMAKNLRKAIARVIFDPGATQGYKGARSLTEWQTDAVLAALSAATALSQVEGSDFDTIESLARKATPGPWLAEGLPYNGYDDPVIMAGDTYIAQTTYDMQSSTTAHNVDADTAYIAAVSPNVVLELIAESRRSTRPREQASWRCFHCDEVFTTVASATAHFGEHQECAPICQIGVVKIREMEDQLERYRAEDSDIQREMYRMQADHRQALIREEERGYAKGVADARAEARPREQEGALPYGWARVHVSPSTPNGPAEYDVDFVYGDDPPEPAGWTPLFAHPLPAASFQAGAEAMREAAAKVCQQWLDNYSNLAIDHSTPREYATGAVLDIKEVVEALPIPAEDKV